MGKVLELRGKREAAWEKAKAFLEEKQSVTDVLSPEDSAAYDKMEAEIVNLGKEIERLERLEAFGENLSAASRPAMVNAPGKAPSTATGRKSTDYADAFWNAIRGRAVSNALKEGSDPDGGYLVPDEFEHMLVEALEEQNIFRRFAHIIQTASGERKIPLVASKGTASWLEEESIIPESDDTFGQISLEAFKLGTLIKVSDELLSDSVFNLEAYVAKEFARRIGKKEEEAFFVGDGLKKPTGIFDPVNGGQTGVTVGSPTALNIDNMIDLYHSLKQPYRGSAVFLTNDSTIKALRKLKSADGQYIWQPSVKEGAPDTILGKPVHTSQFVPEIAAGANVMAFGDFSYYWIADRQSRTFKRLDQLFAVTGQVGFLATQRVDGKLILPEAVQIMKMGS